MYTTTAVVSIIAALTLIVQFILLQGNVYFYSSVKNSRRQFSSYEYSGAQRHLRHKNETILNRGRLRSNPVGRRRIDEHTSAAKSC